MKIEIFDVKYCVEVIRRYVKLSAAAANGWAAVLRCVRWPLPWLLSRSKSAHLSRDQWKWDPKTSWSSRDIWRWTGSTSGSRLNRDTSLQWKRQKWCRSRTDWHHSITVQLRPIRVRQRPEQFAENDEHSNYRQWLGRRSFPGKLTNACKLHIWRARVKRAISGYERLPSKPSWPAQLQLLIEQSRGPLLFCAKWICISWRSF